MLVVAAAAAVVVAADAAAAAVAARTAAAETGYECCIIIHGQVLVRGGSSMACFQRSCSSQSRACVLMTRERILLMQRERIPADARPWQNLETQIRNYCAFTCDGQDYFELPPPAIVKPMRLWTGKQLFNLLMRPST